MELTVKTGKLRVPKYLVFMELLYVCFMQLLISNGVPGAITLICDVINLLLLFYLTVYFRVTVRAVKKYMPFYVLYFLFFFIGSVTALFNGGNLILWLWSMRNFGRFVVFFTAVLVFIDPRDLNVVKKMMYIICHISFVLCAYQFFVQKLKGDYIGGVFGTTHGTANTYLNVFLVIVYALALTDWLCRSRGFISFMIVLCESVSVAVVGELKFFFIEMIIVTFICLAFARKTYRVFSKVLLIVSVGFAALCISIPVMYKLFPVFNEFFHIDTIIQTATDSYTGSGDLGRLTAVYEVATRIFKGDPVKVLFGIGLGNGEYSDSYKILQSSFYVKYKEYNYFWFTDAVVMVQNGLTGLGLYVLTFVYACKELFSRQHRNRKNGIVLTAFTLSIISLLLLVYNVSMNCEIAYLTYAFMAFGLIDSDLMGYNRIRNKKYYLKGDL
ncbi:MAG: hypothetical protein IKE92_07005 [Clostridiales bacterium]|nr:hypothetical protein [Clostridiales bacterium]MBR3248035.1 hypothetical protein [Clostridiales bacterium]